MSGQDPREKPLSSQGAARGAVHSRRHLLRLLSGAAVSAAAAAPLAHASSLFASTSASTTTTGPMQYHIGGIAADGAYVPPPPPPPPPPDDRYVAPEVFSHGDRNGNRIYLTFDDCYSPSLVSQAMDIAESGGARLTFFPIGTVMVQNPDLWRDVLARGHAIENHTWDHTFLSQLSGSDIWSEMAHHVEALQGIVGSDYHEQFIRPPGGDGIFNYDQRVPDAATSLGLKVCMWSVDSNGWRLYPREDPDAINTIISNVMQDFGPGSIVLQHVLGNDVLALPALIDEANRLGLEMVTLPTGIK